MEMEINLRIKRLEHRPPSRHGSELAIYNVVFEGETVDGREPMIKGIRLFNSNTPGRQYVRLPQKKLPNGRYFDLISLPAETLRELEETITSDYAQRAISPATFEISDEEIKEAFKNAGAD